jgi:ferritin-like metal-binding protein YciE
MPDSMQNQLINYLTDAHSIEEQALAQLRTAPDIAGDSELGSVFEAHLAETEEHERLVRERLEALGGSPSRVKDVVMALGGKGFVLFARMQPDTPGKLVAHAHSYEGLEEASYELLRLVAERAGDADTASMARVIQAQERAMRERLAENFDASAEASLRELSPDDLREQVTKYLSDAHAIEAQAMQLLERGPKIAGDPELAEIYATHLEETKQHSRWVEERLEALGGSTTSLKDAALRLGALNWAAFFQAHPDTPGKLAAFAYAFENLEIGGYGQLTRVARMAGDEETATLAQSILGQERAMAGRVWGALDRAATASLQAQGVA